MTFRRAFPRAVSGGTRLGRRSLAFGERKIAHGRVGEVVCLSVRTDVGCTHAEGCPLFPLLNASLQGWRDYYCDSEDRWRGCARYKLAVRGQLIPISLLPNGKDAAHLQRVAERLSTEPTIPRLEPAQPAPHDQDASQTWSYAEPGPAVARPMPAPSETDRPPSPRPPSRRQRAPERRPARRFWWNRLADWMKGSA